MAKYSKTIELILSLSSKECKKFKDYLNSPYFNKIEALPKLFELIILEFKKKKKEYTEKSFLKLGYKNAESRKYIDHLSRLKQHFEGFIALQKVKENEQNFNQYILIDYTFREAGKFFEKKYCQIIRQLGETPIDVHYYQNKFEIEQLYDTYFKYYKDKRVGDTNLQLVSDIIDLDFILKKMCFGVLMLNRANIVKSTNYQFGMMQTALAYLKANPQIDNPLIKLLYYAYEILTGSNVENALSNLNEQLRRDNKKISKDMVNALFIILQNNLKHIKEVKPKLLKEIFKLYEFMLSQNYAQINGNLTVFFFRNVVLICIELEKYDYAKKILEEYKNKLLPENLSQHIYNYCNAILYVNTNNANEALELTLSINFIDKFLKLDLKCLVIMTHYDLKNFDLLEYEITNLNAALTRNKANVESELSYWNFLVCIKHLFNCSTNPNKTKQDVLKTQKLLKQTYRFVNYNWLNKRVQELLKKY